MPTFIYTVHDPRTHTIINDSVDAANQMEAFAAIKKPGYLPTAVTQSTTTVPSAGIISGVTAHMTPKPTDDPDTTLVFRQIDHDRFIIDLGFIVFCPGQALASPQDRRAGHRERSSTYKYSHWFHCDRLP